MKIKTITNVRSVMMGGTGAVCLLYAVMALGTGTPDPLPVWITAVVGVLAALAIGVAAQAAGTSVADQAFDEGYRADAALAQRIAFWVGLWLYPLFGALLAVGFVDWPVAFAAMGTLTAATYLLGVVWLDMRGRS